MSWPSRGKQKKSWQEGERQLEDHVRLFKAQFFSPSKSEEIYKGKQTNRADRNCVWLIYLLLIFGDLRRRWQISWYVTPRTFQKECVRPSKTREEFKFKLIDIIRWSKWPTRKVSRDTWTARVLRLNKEVKYFRVNNCRRTRVDGKDNLQENHVFFCQSMEARLCGSSDRLP